MRESIDPACLRLCLYPLSLSLAATNDKVTFKALVAGKYQYETGDEHTATEQHLNASIYLWQPIELPKATPLGKGSYRRRWFRCTLGKQH